MARKRIWNIDWRAVIQGIVGAIILASLFWIQKTASDKNDAIAKIPTIENTVNAVKKTIDDHSADIGAIPSIKESVVALDKKVDTKSSENLAAVDRVSQKVDEKTKGIVTWDLFNQKTDKINDAVDKLKTDNAEIKGQLNAAAALHQQERYPPSRR